MNGEVINPLKLSANPAPEAEVTKNAPRVIEDFLDQLGGDEQTEVLEALLDGSALIEKHGEREGRELAAHRLYHLLETIGETAANLSDVLVTDDSEDRVFETDTLSELSQVATAYTRRENLADK